MNRGLNRRLIFSDKKDYPLFLETLGEACLLFNVGTGAFCLMPNHYHLLIHTPEGNLSRFMRHLNGV
ncbi:MAG: transposase [Nitrospinae bacterium]|nr:transposase [Nitrospinota bacterium]